MHVATGFFHRLLHSSRHLFGFAFAHAHAAIAITNDGECGEAEDATTLDHFGHAVDRDHFFLQTVVTTVVLHFCLNFCHVIYPCLLELQAGSACGICQGFDATVVGEA